ncbi:MAG: universal stress protein [Thermodesulfobacteriota bacterium]
MEAIKKILVPVDFSENSKTVIDGALLFAKTFDAELNIVFVVQSFQDYSGFFVPHMPITQFEDEMRQSADKKMTDFLAETLPAGVRHTAKVLLGDVAEEIVAYGNEVGVDLIVMGTHGYKGLERVLFGSVAEKVVKGARQPVLTIPPAA